MDNAELLRAFADHADREADGAKGTRWSYRRDFGPVRLLVIDSRAGRILAGGRRSMIGDAEFRWIEEQAGGEFDHLLIGTSLPWLLPPAIGDAQTVNEAAANRPGLRGQLGEKIRQAADFEHWAAFLQSFLRLSDVIARAASRQTHGLASISVLSGDVHHSYAARADMPGSTDTRVHQLVCSPVHNYVPLFIKPAFTLGWSRPAAAVIRWWVRRRGVPAPPVTWSNVCGPLFGNTIATVQIDDRNAEVLFEQPRKSAALEEAGRVSLSRAGG
jgi:hypothetical protein